MPSDPREIEAALRAGRISLKLTPYYAFRYGARGERFTRSDSAFLATLPGQTPATVKKQIEWLAGVLSNRGMPSILLEMHLRVLEKQLKLAVPERRSTYAALGIASAGLRQRRLSAMPEAAAWSVIQAFPEAAGLPRTRLSLGLGQMLVSAVADERLGIVNAVHSLEPFFLDATVFSPAFIAAISATLARARKA